MGILNGIHCRAEGRIPKVVPGTAQFHVLEPTRAARVL